MYNRHKPYLWPARAHKTTYLHIAKANLSPAVQIGKSGNKFKQCAYNIIHAYIKAMRLVYIRFPVFFFILTCIDLIAIKFPRVHDDKFPAHVYYTYIAT